MLTDLTSYESVRAVLGLTTLELPNTLLAAEVYDLVMETEILALGSNLYTDYTTATGESTAEAEAFVRATRLFATHAVAFKCVESLPLTATKAITDGKAGVYRDGNSPYKQAIEKITSAYFLTKRGLQEAYAAYNNESIAEIPTVTILSVSSPDYDPVTGG